MKTTRAYITSLGLTGVLVASSIALFLVVSALVAFRGWPGGGVVEGLKGLVVDRDQPSLQVTGPAQAALGAAPGAAAVAPAPPAGAVAAVPAAGGGGGPAAVSPGPGGGESAPASVTTPVPSGGAPRAAAPTPSGGVGAPAVSMPSAGDLSNTTQDTTHQAGEAVGQVNPQLGQGLDDTGHALGEIVTGLQP
jgi:hypothetical protein